MSTQNKNQNYSHAVQNLFRKKQKKKAYTPMDTLKQLPSGWIYIPKHGKQYYENQSTEEKEAFEYYLEALRMNELVCDYMNRFVATTWLEKLQNGYNNEEIQQYIQSVFDDAEYEENENQDENYEYYDDDSDEYDSSY